MQVRLVFFVVSLVAAFALLPVDLRILGRKPSIRTRDEYLLGVTNNREDGTVDVYIISAAQQEKYFKNTLKNTQLSPACGEHYHRCKDLIFTEQTLQLSSSEIVYQIVTFVPVQNGLVLMEFRANEIGIWQVYKNYTIRTTNCDPVALYRHTHGNSIHLVCIRLEHTLTFYEVQLGTDSIDRSSLRLLKSVALPHLDLSEVSNFEYVSLGAESDLQRVYFSIASSLYVFNPTELDYLPNVGEIGFCSAAESLVYTGNWALFAYCRSGSVVYFNLHTSTWFNQTDPSERTYRCPDTDVDLTVYPSREHPFIKYHVWSTKLEKQFALQGTNFDSGQCFGKPNHTFYAYVDRENGSYVVDTSLPDSESGFKVSSSSCPETGCRPLSVLEERYVVVSDEGVHSAVHVVDCIEYCSEIINVEHFSVDLVAMVHVRSDGDSETPMGKEKSESNGIILKCVVPVSIGAVLILIVLTITFVLCKRRRDSRPRTPNGSTELLLLDLERSNITTPSEELDKSDPEEEDGTKTLTKSCTQSASSILLPDGNSGTLIGTKRSNLRPTTPTEQPPLLQQTPRLLCAVFPTQPSPDSQSTNSRPSSPTPSDDHSDITNSKCHPLADASSSPTSVVTGHEMPVPYHAMHGRDLIRTHSEDFQNDLVKKSNQRASP